MVDKIEEAWTEYQFGKMIDPVHRYEHDDKEVFRAGWLASQKPHVPVGKESVWITAPVAPDDDPE